MAPSTSDTHGGHPPHRRWSDEIEIDRRSIQGHEALVFRTEREVAVEWRGPRPLHFGLRVGDTLKDADADISSPRIAEWAITDITPQEIVGEDRRTGESRTFDRERVERGLVVGNFGTNLSDFVRATVHAVGSWDEYDPDATGTGVVYRGNPYLTIVVFGNNGRTYGLRYRYVEEGSDDTVTLWEEDTEVAALDPPLRERLFSVTEAALTTAGYDVE